MFELNVYTQLNFVLYIHLIQIKWKCVNNFIAPLLYLELCILAKCERHVHIANVSK